MNTLKENIANMMEIKGIEQSLFYALVTRVQPEDYDAVMGAVEGIEPNPRIKIVRLIAQLLRCSLDELFNYSPTACALHLRFIIPVNSFEFNELEKLNKKVTELLEDNFDVVGTVEVVLHPTDLEVEEVPVIL